LAQLFLDKEKEEQEKKKKESEEVEKTLQLIKDQLKAEAEEKLKKIEAEKVQLEQKLSSTHGGTIKIDGTEFPSYWATQPDGILSSQLIDVDPNSDEYVGIVNKFFQSMPQFAVTKLQRNQNKRLYMWYFLRKKEIAATNKGNANEVYLFHGSAVANIPIILTEGLDFRVSNMGGAIGAGIYFAETASTSSGYVQTQFGKNTQGSQMLLCKVALGQSTAGKQGLRRPPQIHGSSRLYDSVSGKLGGKNMYCIFDNHQSYPEYIIHYSQQILNWNIKFPY